MVMKNNNKAFDIIISGGGLSGCLMALSVADLTHADGRLLSIAIVEANDNTAVNKKVKTPLFDERVLALSHGSSVYLNKVGAWQHLHNDACAINDIHISDRGHYGKARLEAKKHNVSALGYVIEMALIGKSLLAEITRKKNVQWFCPDNITDIQWQASNDINQVEVKLNSGQSISSRLLLACDGAQSMCRQLADIQVVQSDYQQVAIIANVATARTHKNKAFERFTEFGPIAMLPLKELNGQNRCSLVWTLSVEQSEAILALNDDEFCRELELKFGSWLGEIIHVGKRDMYPLSLLQAQQQTYHRMALIGNAAHTIHPIAGQGFNLGLRDVQVMAKLIEDQIKADGDIGSFTLLNNYANQRQVDQNHVIEITDSLVTLFANDYPPLIAGRNIGLKVMNYITPIKNTIVNKLMGY